MILLHLSGRENGFAPSAQPPLGVPKNRPLVSGNIFTDKVPLLDLKNGFVRKNIS